MKPKLDTVHNAWSIYYTLVKMLHPELNMLTSKLAFYAGARAMYAMILHREKGESVEQYHKKIEALRNELKEAMAANGATFFDEVMTDEQRKKETD